jgi:hypothetical protein
MKINKIKVLQSKAQEISSTDSANLLNVNYFHFWADFLENLKRLQNDLKRLHK